MATPETVPPEIRALFGSTPLSSPPPEEIPATPSDRDRDSPAPPAHIPVIAKRKRDPPFWVSPPRLPSAERAKYKRIPSGRVRDAVDDQDPMEVVHDVTLHGNVFYFARMRSGLFKKARSQNENSSWSLSQFIDLFFLPMTHCF